MTRKTNYPKSRKHGSGGARQGAGRPKKDPTTRLAYRVPTVIAEPLDKRIREVIQSWLKIGTSFPMPPWPTEPLVNDAINPWIKVSRAVVSAHLDKEDKAVSKIIKKQKK